MTSGYSLCVFFGILAAALIGVALGLLRRRLGRKHT